METRYTMGFLAFGIACAIVLAREWRFLRSGWLWVGVGISILVWLPNLIWQMQHRFISLEFLSYLHARDLRQGRYAGFLRDQLWLCVNLVTAPSWDYGFISFVLHHDGDEIAPDKAKVVVLTPDGQRIGADFDLAKLP